MQNVTEDDAEMQNEVEDDEDADLQNEMEEPSSESEDDDLTFGNSALNGFDSDDEPEDETISWYMDAIHWHIVNVDYHSQPQSLA